MTTCKCLNGTLKEGIKVIISPISSLGYFVGEVEKIETIKSEDTTNGKGIVTINFNKTFTSASMARHIEMMQDVAKMYKESLEDLGLDELAEDYEEHPLDLDTRNRFEQMANTTFEPSDYLAICTEPFVNGCNPYNSEVEAALYFKKNSRREA